MKSMVINNTAINLGAGETPFLPGRNVMALNQTAGNLIVQGSDDNGVADPYATVVTVPLNGTIEIDALPQWIKVSTAANVTLIGGP